MSCMPSTENGESLDICNPRIIVDHVLNAFSCRNATAYVLCVDNAYGSVGNGIASSRMGINGAGRRYSRTTSLLCKHGLKPMNSRERTNPRPYPQVPGKAVVQVAIWMIQWICRPRVTQGVQVYTLVLPGSSMVIHVSMSLPVFSRPSSRFSHNVAEPPLPVAQDL